MTDLRRVCLGLLIPMLLAGPRLDLACAADAAWRSHPPMRPLAEPSKRPLGPGPARFVDAVRGNDPQDGSLEHPWRTLEHALQQAKPGETLYLRSGTYHEHAVVRYRGSSDQPLTIRSYPGELAILDGGLREFQDDPQSAWEPWPAGGEGECRSTRSYPGLGERTDGPNVLGLFGDSMVPLHGYRFASDLRSSNESLSKLGGGKTEQGEGVYCGPGVWFDPDTERIHIRLAHTHQQALGTENYRGETDPRKVPLVIAGISSGPALSLEGARFVRLQDLVVRGARTATLALNQCQSIDLDGVTVYGGGSAIQVVDTAGLRLWNCACRGIAAPWTWRGSLKYRAIEARIFSASGWTPTGNDNRDFELAYSEFTDCVDGVFIGNVRNVRFHHNLLDNVSDDGIFLTAGTAFDGTTPGGNVHIYQNLLARCLTTFAFGVGHGRQKALPVGRQTGSGVSIYRNVFDFRRPVMYQQPDEGQPNLTTYGRVASDHGGPLWEPMTIYHNTILAQGPPFRGYYAAGLGGHLATGSLRYVFNNLIVQSQGPPGVLLTSPVPSGKSPAGASTEPAFDLRVDGNLHWSYEQDDSVADLLGRFRASRDFEFSRHFYPPGWTTHDVVADPQFVAFHPDWRQVCDVRLRRGSPAVDAGFDLPAHWSDPMRAADAGQPDIGALPLGLQPAWSVGVRGRLNASGQPNSTLAMTPTPSEFLATTALPAPQVPARPALILQGYPAFDAPLVEFALRRQQVPVESVERTWIHTKDYGRYGLVVVVGNLVRAKIEPNMYSDDDLDHLRQFLNQGGTLLLMRGNQTLFRSTAGRQFLQELAGTSGPKADGIEIRLPGHPWVRHLRGKEGVSWIAPKSAEPLPTSRGETIIGNSAGLATLYRVRVGRGQLIYVGWELAASLPPGRTPSTIEQERQFEEQMQVLLALVQDVGMANAPD